LSDRATTLESVTDDEGADDPSEDADGQDTSPGEPDPDEDTEASGPERVVPSFLGSHIGAFVGMSDVIKNMQFNLAPALRVPLPEWPLMAMTIQMIEETQRSAFNPAWVAQIAASIPPVDTKFLHNAVAMTRVMQAQQEQIAKIIQAALPLLDGMFPPNWKGVHGIETELIELIVLDEGIPLVAVPRAATVQLLIHAPDAQSRRSIVGRRWQSITTDCEASLSTYQRGDIADFVAFARKAVAALRGGHSEAAQALAANLLESLARQHFNADRIVIATAHKKKQRFEIDDYTIRFAFAIAPVWAAYSTFWPNSGDPVPRTFTRHASAHAVSTAQYSRTNTVIALMLVTSLLWVLEDQDRRQAARAS
jgi:hypothetical protein